MWSELIYHYLIIIIDEIAENVPQGDISDDDIDGDFTTIVTYYNLTLSDPIGPFAKTLTSCDLQELFYAIQVCYFFYLSMLDL